jgi:hypothetical protein
MVSSVKILRMFDVEKTSLCFTRAVFLSITADRRDRVTHAAMDSAPSVFVNVSLRVPWGSLRMSSREEVELLHLESKISESVNGVVNAGTVQVLALISELVKVL